MTTWVLAQVPVAKIEIHGSGAAWIMCCNRKQRLIQERARANWTRLIKKQRHLKRLQRIFQNVGTFLQNFPATFLKKLSKAHKD